MIDVARIGGLFGLHGKVAIVTGGAGAIGTGITTLFAEAGATVIIAERNMAAATALADRLGDAVTAAYYDQASVASIEALVAGVVDRFGGLDVMVNCAAAFGFQSLDDLTEAQFDRITAVNMRGVAICCQQAVRAMRHRGGGSIINISSISGSRFVLYDSIAYAASKAGNECITRTIARECGEDRIRVNSVIPGAIWHDSPDPEMAGYPMRGPLMEAGFIPLKWADPNPDPTLPVLAQRAGKPQDIAAACLYLASDAGRYVTGQLIAVDGGISVA